MASGKLSKEKLMKMNFKDAEKNLIKIRGIGPWTANYVLMRCLRFPTAFHLLQMKLKELNSTIKLQKFIII